MFPLGAGGSEKKLRPRHTGTAVRTGSARQQDKRLVVKDTGSAVSRDRVTLGKGFGLCVPIKRTGKPVTPTTQGCSRSK